MPIYIYYKYTFIKLPTINYNNTVIDDPFNCNDLKLNYNIHLLNINITINPIILIINYYSS